MKSIKAVFLAILALLTTATAFAQLKLSETESAKLYMTLHTVGTLQALQHENVFDATGKQLGDLEAGFQNAYGDFGFVGKFGKNDEIEVVFDMYLSSRNHPSTTYGNEGYIVLRGVPENLQGLKFLEPVLSRVDLKAGHMLLDFGDTSLHRSNNAIVQSNPLIGNFVIDANIVSIGMQVTNKPGRINWLIGMSNGTTTEDWAFGRGFSYNAKLAVYPVEPLRLSASYIAADHSDNPNKTAGGSQMQMFTGNRSGERYGGVLGGGQAPGGVFPQAGEKFSAAQFDLTWKSELPIQLYGHYGITQDDDLNGSLPGEPKEKWNYYAGDVVYRLTPTIYAAARYSAAQADMLTGRTSEGRVDRIQVGGGLWLTRNLLVKVEYVTQKYRDFAEGDLVNNNIQAWREPEFGGVVTEVSFAF